MRTIAAFSVVTLAACTQLPITTSTTTSSSGSSSSGGPTDVTLEPPAPGQGFQYATGPFEVAAGEEVQDCYFFQIPGAASDDVWVHKVELSMNDGSHHMNMFRVKTELGLKTPANGGDAVQRAKNGMGECFKSPNWADWPLIVNTQQGGHLDWTLPDGVAHRFHGGEWVMLQTHYVNATTQGTPLGGAVKVNFWTMPAGDVQSELGTIFATKQSIRICQHDTNPKFHGTCQIRGNTPVTVVGANGHFHSRGRQFEIFSWDGMTSTDPAGSAKFYSSDTWDDPPMKRSPELMQSLPAGGGVWYTCAFEWTPPPASVGCEALNAADKAKGAADEDLDCCYTFGGIVEKSEHCNAFVYYYPKVDDVFCN